MYEFNPNLFSLVNVWAFGQRLLYVVRATFPRMKYSLTYYEKVSIISREDWRQDILFEYNETFMSVDM